MFTISIADVSAEPPTEHGVVTYTPGMFDGWPANNGIWTWDNGKEVLVGFTRGTFVEKDSHSIAKPYENLLARSTDGGRSWTVERPENFVGRSSSAVSLDKPIDFSSENFAIRMVGDKYHGAEAPKGEFFYSTDRGRSWQGPYLFTGLENEEQLQDLPLTPRTDYLTIDSDSCLAMLSARTGADMVNDRSFVARTDDGGQIWRFVGWVIALSDPARAVMPSTVSIDDGTLISALRRRHNDREGNQTCWLDTCISRDGGQTWSDPHFIADTGNRNGNPPGLILLDDNRLAIAYANRRTRQLLARLSDDLGKTWTDPVELRADYHADSFNFSDMGYCRLFQRADGGVMVIYYWATRDRPEPHIEYTLWRP